LWCCLTKYIQKCFSFLSQFHYHNRNKSIYFIGHRYSCKVLSDRILEKGKSYTTYHCCNHVYKNPYLFLFFLLKIHHHYQHKIILFIVYFLPNDKKELHQNHYHHHFLFTDHLECFLFVYILFRYQLAHQSIIFDLK